MPRPPPRAPQSTNHQPPKGPAMRQAWRDTLKEAWLRTNWLLQSVIWLFCGYLVSYSDWREYYSEEDN